MRLAPSSPVVCSPEILLSVSYHELPAAICHLLAPFVLSVSRLSVVRSLLSVVGGPLSVVGCQWSVVCCHRI